MTSNHKISSLLNNQNISKIQTQDIMMSDVTGCCDSHEVPAILKQQLAHKLIERREDPWIDWDHAQTIKIFEK